MKHLYEIYAVKRQVNNNIITIEVEVCSMLTGEIFTGKRHARCASGDKFDTDFGTKLATERALKQALTKFSKDVHRECKRVVKDLNETYHYLEKIDRKLARPDGTLENWQEELEYEDYHDIY